MYGHIHALCRQFLKESGVDPLFLIWDALSSGAEGKTGQGISALDKITNRVAMGLPISVAQLCIHKMAPMQDFAAIGQLETEIESLQKSANASAVVHAAEVYWLTGDTMNALNLVQPLTTQAPANKSAAAIVGWIKLSTGDRNSGRWFDMAAADPSSNRQTEPMVLYGKAMYYACISRWQDAIQVFVQLSEMVDFPEIAMERARVYIAMNNWDLAVESAAESTGKCVSDCDIHLINALNCLSQIGDLDTAKHEVDKLCACLDKFESENAKYTMSIVKVLSSLSWRDPDIVLKCANTFANIAKAHNEDPDVLVVYGKLLLISKRANEAKDAFQNAQVASSESTAALAGLIDAQIELNQLSEAHDQLEFLEAMSGGNSSLELASLKSKYTRVSGGDVDIEELLQSMKKYIDYLQQLFTPQSPHPSNDDSPQTLLIDKYIENFNELNLSSFSDALTEAMYCCNTLERSVPSPKNGPVCDIIAAVLEYIPGAVPFSYYLAVLAFGEGRYSQATKAIQSVLGSRWGFNGSQCHLLLAQVRLQTKQFDEAEQSLNRAVSFDFSIRNSLRYNIINVQLLEARGQYENAIKTLREVIKGPEYQTASNSEKVNIFLMIARCQKKDGKEKEAENTLNNALSSYKDTFDEDRIQFYMATLYSDTGRIREGLDILENIKTDSPMYTKAKKRAAKIYLNKLNDKGSYIRCFKELVSGAKNKTTFVLLGDALMEVKRFDEAVECFNQALSCDRYDQEVALHLARALFVVHDFDASLAAYKHAIQVSNNSPKALLEYCQTLLKLKRLDEARDAASDAMSTIDSDSHDWEAQAASADFLDLLSIINAKTSDYEQSNEEIQEALSIYERIISSGRSDISNDALNNLRVKAGGLYKRLAEQAIERDDSKGAIETYEKALSLDPNSTSVLLSLAKLRLEKGESEKCQEICQQLLRIDPNCEEAALILAEVSQSENLEDLEEAFSKSPTFYRTLVRLIEKCARAGELERVPSLFEKCPDKEAPGLKFCKGLYNVYIGNPQEALKLLNGVRSDPEFGIQALQLIFFIYANPNRKYVWCETKPLATSKDLDAAKKVLSKLDPSTIDVQQFKAILLLSQNTTESVTEALEIYNQGDNDDINSIIGRCKCFIRLDKQRDATKYLNGIIHGEATHQNFATFVEAFLMMTYISIKDSQIDEADRYVDRAIELNRSCLKAWEMKAILSEKKKDYMSAAEAFKQAWDLSSHTQLGIGFKLALNYMRVEDPVNAIKVCRAIMEQHPNYPKLKETIFLPCCAMLRP